MKETQIEWQNAQELKRRHNLSWLFVLLVLITALLFQSCEKKEEKTMLKQITVTSQVTIDTGDAAGNDLGTLILDNVFPCRIKSIQLHASKAVNTLSGVMRNTETRASITLPNIIDFNPPVGTYGQKNYFYVRDNMKYDCDIYIQANTTITLNVQSSVDIIDVVNPAMLDYTVTFFIEVKDFI